MQPMTGATRFGKAQSQANANFKQNHESLPRTVPSCTSNIFQFSFLSPRSERARTELAACMPVFQTSSSSPSSSLPNSEIIQQGGSRTSFVTLFESSLRFKI